MQAKLGRKLFLNYSFEMLTLILKKPCNTCMEGNSGSCLCYVVDICLHFFFVEAAISVEPSQKVS